MKVRRVVDHLRERFGVARVRVDGRREFAHGRLFHARRDLLERRVIGAQQLDGVPEADAVGRALSNRSPCLRPGKRPGSATGSSWD
jgi:hypothetical protein